MEQLKQLMAQYEIERSKMDKGVKVAFTRGRNILSEIGKLTKTLRVEVLQEKNSL